MKKLPSFDEFLNESSKKNKDFKDVKPGDTALDVSHEKWTVLDKATGRTEFLKKLRKYDESGAMEDFLNSPQDWEDQDNYSPETLQMVAAKSSKHGIAVFTYDDGGLTVYK